SRTRTVMYTLQQGKPVRDWLEEEFADLASKATADMAAEGHDPAQLVLERALDMRYLGQSYELTVPDTHRDVAAAFHQAHERRYGYQRPESDVQIVTLRLKSTVPARPLLLEEMRAERRTGTADPVGEKPVWFGDRFWQTALYQRRELQPVQTLDGPAVIFQYDATIVVPPGWRGELDSFANILLTYEA
ncbi:MAG: hydantoinase/oxoprolinase family protein, partial [Candidatus Promineifilaceae bacterium]